MMTTPYDVLVVGGRCAGAATALLLARAGARVLVVERGRYGTDTLSTHALMRGAVLQLARWGVLRQIVASGAPPIEHTTFRYNRHSVSVAIEPKFGVSALFAPRRSVLDRVLVDAAVASGATFEFGVPVSDLTWDDHGRVNGVIVGSHGGARQVIRARLVVGADGLYSTVASRVGAATRHAGRHATASLYGYWAGATGSGYEWVYRDRVSVGAIPTNGAMCVFVSVPALEFGKQTKPDAAAAYRRLLVETAPDLHEALNDARLIEQVRGFGGHRGVIRQSHGAGWALVGDAGYFKDPLTAHGITDALRDAELLARAVLQGDDAALAGYEVTRNALSRGLFAITDEIASFDWDDERLQTLHRALSREMAAETRALAELEPVVWPSRLDNARHAL